MDVRDLEKLADKMRQSGHLNEILDDEGLIVPSADALRWVTTNHTDEGDAEKWRLAQAETLIRLAKKCQISLT